MLSKISSILIPIAGKLNNNRYLNVLRNAFMLSFPLTIFGSIFVVVANLPFLNSFMGPDTISSFQSALSIASNSSIGIMTLFVVFGIGYYLTKSYEVESVFGGAISLVSFFLLTPFVISSQNGELIGGGIPVESLGAKGMFLGMISAFISTTIFVYLTKKNMVIKMPESVPPAVSKSFEALIPAFLTLTIFMLVSIFITYVFNTDLHKIIYNAIQAPLVGL